jgi:hypothetical protein
MFTQSLASFLHHSMMVGVCKHTLGVILFVCFVVSFFFFETGSHYVAGLELMIFLPQPPECWDYRCVLPYKVQCS